jgi:hypothetical protein
MESPDFQEIMKAGNKQQIEEGCPLLKSIGEMVSR